MNDMKSKRQSLETIKARRPKPLIAKAGATRKRTPYKCGGKANK